MPRSNTSAIAKWTDDTEIVSVTLILRAISDIELSSNYTTAFHAWFLHQVRDSDPQLSAYLHDGQSEKAFAISPLNGNLIANTFLAKVDSTYTWTISALSNTLCTWLKTWYINHPETINLYKGNFEIEQININQPPTTYNNLWSSSSNLDPRFTLAFLAPTCFRSKNHHLPLPIPTNIFHSYLRRWNDFAPEAFPQEEFLAWIEKVVYITNYDLSCTKVAVAKQGYVTGFTGTVEFAIDLKASHNSDFERLLSALIKLANYCGTGYKTTFGLGQTRLIGKDEVGNWKNGKESIVATPIQEHLVKRIAELTELFLQTKKRQGGDRAQNTATVWATILARRELGESLKAIAIDLNMPYETVRKYSQAARKAISAFEKVP
ncbi:MAG: CRISPR-associated endoribonuclease Cas6 [Pseudanabaena sp.]|jgi:CRISPR-associated endoribonuclease Cas6|nr:CRISPR-associated endoribonuclease Cas6 [Pseudanabaena sp. M090S1SP2A07QC]MCA6505287.1 CRISPR-associated endoribonuclease Cas6 [Pseudanabaena sp. M172S2SP2A07QC]MCA6509820.1 CRISPR-associated endoribonuclease Cas6 [Pseudanabaena sp. M109S1SP2A07QC]MCA6518775.1 CRISPR-associated endoribonuclease Cas6 [Pseudanabaena sp. M110S1SP2A07QC]MCA6521692.1 CRISPR-associated endoribonuclease Cas6 [Pseudanabaena sp. M051S1SP2A07QC]MCA6527863.1 CRISPR-associated endoribonuclease Cas6 [Pseudanabaena sp. M